MASGSTVFSVGKNMNLYVVTSESNIDVTNNKSRVNVTVYLRNHTTYYDLDKISKLTVTIGGTEVYKSSTHSYDLRSTNQITVKSGIYRDITHAADGSGSAVVSATFQTDVHGSATVNVTQPLTTIARASTPTLSSTTPAIGSTITVYMNSKSSNFKHSVYHDFHAGKWTLLESNVVTSCSFALPLATYAARIPNATSGNGRVQIDTYNNGSFIGSKTVSFTASLPASVVPTVASISASDLNTTVNTTIGDTTYVQSQSKPRFTANTAAGIHGSTIKSYEFKFDGLTYTNNGNIKDFPAIKGSGSMTGTVTVTDSRGRKSAAKSVSLTVLPYSIPAITAFTVIRTGADDATLQARRAGKMSSLKVGGVEKNKIDLKIDTASRGGSTWTNRYTIGSTSETFDSSVNLTGSFPNTSSFDVRFTLSDVFNSVNRVVSVSTASVAMSMFGNTGVAIGKIYDTGQGGVLQVGPGNSVFDGRINVGGAFSVAGSKNAIHATRDGFRLTPAYETAESYLGDIGESKTDYTNEVKVYIETLFHDTVNTEVSYQVFLQSYGDGFVWVSERNYDHFIVKSSAPNIAFGWELKAKRRGYEEDRLVLSETTFEDAQKMEGLHGGYSYSTQSKEEGVTTKEEGAKI